MYIPSIYVLISAEIIFLLMVASAILVIYVLKLNQRIKENQSKPPEEDKSINPGTSYAVYLQQELERNSKKTEQQHRIESEKTTETTETISTDEQQSALLEARDMFLNIEKSATEYAENENLFWDHIYSGMTNILTRFKTIEHDTSVVTREVVEHKTTTKEKVFYIETQGKKVDGEVNKLKDIIYEQENTLSSLQKALSRSVEHEETDNNEITELQIHMKSFERQLNDSKMCMEILELENERLQHELNELDTRLATPNNQKTNEQSDKNAHTGSADITQINEILETQKNQIDKLNLVIGDLKLEADQAERLKTTIKDFTRTSQEMMGCIAILEEENEHLKLQVHESEHHNGNADSGDHDASQYKAQLKGLEQVIIKKDVAYAKLQDEFSAMEKEYLAIYEAMHGEK